MFSAVHPDSARSSSNRDNFAPPILNDNKITVDSLSGIGTNDAGGIKGVEFDAPPLHEASSQDNVEVRLLAEVDVMNGGSLAKRNRPFADLHQTSVALGAEMTQGGPRDLAVSEGKQRGVG